MHLIETMRRIAEISDSPFRAQLAREDVARLEKLHALAQTSPDLETFRRDGLHVGWTQGDLRTHSLTSTLHPLMDRIFEYRTAGASEAREAALIQAWQDFNAQRMKVLMHCL